MGIFKRLAYKQQIHFVYSERHKHSGSTVMRGKQLAKITQNALAESRDIFYTPASAFIKNSILFMTKGALQILGPREIENIKNNKNRLIFDPVDWTLPEEKAQHADVIVAASKVAYSHYTKTFPKTKVHIIDHHVDPRLKKLNWQNPPSNFKAGYFGELINTIVSPGIERLVDFHQVDTHRQKNGWLQKLPDYNFHYAIRSDRHQDRHKPFLKGFTAAFCNANLLIQESEKEAMAWLGKDYPYILKGEVNEQAIIKGLERVKDSFGSKEWHQALEVMQDIKEKTSDSVIADQLTKLFDEAVN